MATINLASLLKEYNYNQLIRLSQLDPLAVVVIRNSVADQINDEINSIKEEKGLM